jgi:hypothetical protein
MKKTIALITILLSGLVYYGSNNPNITETFTSYRTGGLFNVAHRGLGDLYNMSFLSAYNMPLEYNLRKVESKEKEIRLFLFCDSYLISHVEKEHFYGTDSLIKIKWWDNASYQTIEKLDASKKNILLIEMSERFVRDACVDLGLMTAPLTFGSDLEQQQAVDNSPDEKKDGNAFLNDHFFNPNINSNLELNLFSYKIFNPIKEIKGDINYKFFHRTNKDVFVDEQNHFLYFKPTVSGDHKTNAFFPMDSAEFSQIVITLNKTKEHYKKHGFDEVYFSFVPNPVSVVNPDLGAYNQLMPFLSNVDSSLFKKIDVYSLFKSNPKKYYAPNDTHWNSTGLQTWLDVTNTELKRILEKHSGKSL